MEKIFKGRPVLAGRFEGQALVTRRGFNTLASFYKSMLEGAAAAICGDQDNEALFGQNLTDKIICLPKGIGSTSAGAAWHRVAEMGIAPKAMLFAEHIDSLSAAGLVLADVWVGRRVFAVDQLGPQFLTSVKNGQRLEVREDGTVTVY